MLSPRRVWAVVGMVTVVGLCATPFLRSGGERLDVTPLVDVVDGLPVLDHRPYDFANVLTRVYLVVLGPVAVEDCRFEADADCVVRFFSEQSPPLDELQASTPGAQISALAPYRRIGDLYCQVALYPFDLTDHLVTESLVVEITEAVGERDARWLLWFECGRWHEGRPDDQGAIEGSRAYATGVVREHD